LSLEDLARLAIDKALEQDAEFAEFRYHLVSEEVVVLRDGEPEGPRTRFVEGVGIRVIVGGVPAFSSTNVITERGVTSAVDEAVKAARAMGGLLGGAVRLSEAEASEVRYLVTEGRRWEDTPLEEKLEILRELEEGLKERLRGVSSRRTLSLGLRRETKLVLNNSGAFVQATTPLVWLRYRIALSSLGYHVEKVARLGGTGGLEVLDAQRVVDRVLEAAENLREVLERGASPPIGRMDIVVGCELAGLIAHECVGHALEADRIMGREEAQAGGSYVQGVGARMGSEHVEVSDDPTIPSSAGYYLYDDEGVRARKRRLVVGGEVRELLHNRETAAHFGVDSNASARASSYNREPIVRMSNTFFEPGDYSLDELLEDVKLGIYVKSCSEWNIDDVRESQRYTGLEAYLVERGEVKAPVRSPVIDVSTQELLGSLDARGRDLEFHIGICVKGSPHQQIPVWTGGPTLRFRGIHVSRR